MDNKKQYMIIYRHQLIDLNFKIYFKLHKKLNNYWNEINKLLNIYVKHGKIVLSFFQFYKWWQ